MAALLGPLADVTAAAPPAGLVFCTVGSIPCIHRLRVRIAFPRQLGVNLDTLLFLFLYLLYVIKVLATFGAHVGHQRLPQHAELRPCSQGLDRWMGSTIDQRYDALDAVKDYRGGGPTERLSSPMMGIAITAVNRDAFSPFGKHSHSSVLHTHCWFSAALAVVSAPLECYHRNDQCIYFRAVNADS